MVICMCLLGGWLKQRGLLNKLSLVEIKSESRDSTLDVYSVEAATFSISGHRAAVYIVHLPTNSPI